MKKQLTAMLLTAAFCINLTAPVFAAAPAAESTRKTEVVYRDSGDLTLPKLSEGEIFQLLSDNPLTLPSDIYEERPHLSNPYSAGKLKDEALEAALNRLNALRRIAGLQPVELDEQFCEDAQHGAVVLAALDNGLNHHPDQPSDMDYDFYQKGYDADASSNLYWGPTLTEAVDGFMKDPGDSNALRVGHRRWQLNPYMARVGFGQAKGKQSNSPYTAEKVFGYGYGSQASCDFDFIAWPASGNFPKSQFESDTSWSVTLNLHQYETPQQENIKVTLTRQSDGRKWTFSDESSNGLFNVDTTGYGVANCIVFRPTGISQYDGVYTVHIDGLKTLDGEDVTDFDYKVNFFDAGHGSSGGSTWGGNPGNTDNTGSTGNTGTGDSQGIDDGVATAIMVGCVVVLGAKLVYDVAKTVQSMPVEISGSVKLADGTPLKGATLTLTKNGKTAATTTAKADGSFKMKVERGDYTLNVGFYNEAGQYYEQTHSLKVPASDMQFVF